MGPLLLLKSTANDHEWAQCSYQGMLPIPLDGPNITAEIYYQWPRMGPVILSRNATDALGMGPVILSRNAMLPMPLDGPIIAVKKYCQ